MRGFLYGFLGVLIVAVLMFEAAADAVKYASRAQADYQKTIRHALE